MFLFNFSKKHEDGSVKSSELFKILNRIFFREVSCSKIMCCSGWSILGIYSTTQLKYVMPIVAKIAYGGVIIVSGVSLSAWIISYFIYKKEYEEAEIIETEYEKYLNFINKDYEIFIDIYKNEKEDYFTNECQEFIGKLKNSDNHETYELPYSYNPTLTFFYDSDSNSFHYYCKSDVSCKILNSICRTYTISKKCIQLFQNEEEIQYMKGEACDIADVSFSNVSSDTTSSNSLSSVASNAQPEEKEEESNGFVNIFYSKKGKKERSKKLEEISRLKINKFIYKGTIEEYKKDFLKNKTNSKKTSYEEYLAQCSK